MSKNADLVPRGFPKRGRLKRLQCKNDDKGKHDLTLKKTKPTQAIPSSPLFLWTELSSIFSQLCQEGILRVRMILGK